MLGSNFKKLSMRSVICGLILFSACANVNNKCQEKIEHVLINGSSYVFKGCIQDSRENGQWKMIDNNSKVVEVGDFTYGIRQGKWIHRNDTIIWKKFTYDDLGIITNIPELFRLTEAGENWVKLEKKDSLGKLMLVFSVRDIKKDSIDIDNYYKVVEQSVRENGMEVKSTISRFEAEEKTYYVVSLDSYNQEKRVQILDIYGNTKDGKFVDITIFFEEKDRGLASKIFTSVFSSFYVSNERFLNPFAPMQNYTEQ